MVGVKKKTLDDYLMKIRKGKNDGFDFEEHKQKGIGLLNEYNEMTM
jgi:hypothetical protein